MSEELKLEISVIISNTIRIIAFIVLAIIFDKWWIALFSALFLNSIKQKGAD